MHDNILKMENQSITIDGRIQLSGMLIYDNKNNLLLLHRIKHDHYETPGGKVEKLDCEDSVKIIEKDFLNTAIRETFEELGQEFIFEEPKYLKGINFEIPNGQKATAHKFKTKILFGTPKINEPELFDEIKWFSKEELKKEESKISPDLKLFLKEELLN